MSAVRGPHQEERGPEIRPKRSSQAGTVPRRECDGALDEHADAQASRGTSSMEQKKRDARNNIRGVSGYCLPDEASDTHETSAARCCSCLGREPHHPLAIHAFWAMCVLCVLFLRATFRHWRGSSTPPQWCWRPGLFDGSRLSRAHAALLGRNKIFCVSLVPVRLSTAAELP